MPRKGVEQYRDYGGWDFFAKIFLFAHTARMKQSVVAKKRERTKEFLSIVFLFFVISFLGWCMEKATFFFAYGGNADRGFLRLPFCTIYGSSLVAVRFILGVPQKKEFPYPRNMLFLIGYAVGAALFATAAELITGFVFDRYFGLRLWSYRGYPHQYKGYICLPMSITWGGLITIAMAALWAPAERALQKIPALVLGTLDLVLVGIVTIDFVYCLLSVI